MFRTYIWHSQPKRRNESKSVNSLLGIANSSILCNKDSPKCQVAVKRSDERNRIERNCEKTSESEKESRSTEEIIQLCIHKGYRARRNNYSIAFCFKGWSNHWLCGACLSFFLFFFFFSRLFWMNSNAVAVPSICVVQNNDALHRRNILWMMWIPAGEFRCEEQQMKKRESFFYFWYCFCILFGNTASKQLLLYAVLIDCRKKWMCLTSKQDDE